MEKHDGDQKGPMTTLQGSTVKNPDSTGRITVRASPNLFFTPPVSRMHSEWTPFLNRDWNDVFPEISPEALVADAITQPLCSLNINGDSQQRGDIDGSSPLHVLDGNIGCVDDVYPCGTLIEKSQSDLSFCPETPGAPGSVVTQKITKKHARHKYDPYIDQSLSPAQKKKQRRILANRASARRSRQKKKEALAHLLRREKELIHQRDAAVSGLNQQIRINAALRQMLQDLQSQLAMYHKAKLEAMIPQLYGESDRSMSSSDPFLTIPPTSDPDSLLDPCNTPIWNPSSCL